MSILATILDFKRLEVAARSKLVPLAELEDALPSAPPIRSLQNALRRPAAASARVLAEFKRASPSAGPIAPSATPEKILPIYEKFGASAASILTDSEFFDGRPEFLARARKACALPLLRKDFITSGYQIVESRILGADAILLIAAALEEAQMRELWHQAQELGLEVLVEVHDEEEAALSYEMGARLIGVNHRNLRTFKVDLSLSEQLSEQIPKDAVLVGESGVKTRADVERLEAAGVHAVLVGESLMRADDPGSALAALLGGTGSAR